MGLIQSHEVDPIGSQVVTPCSILSPCISLPIILEVGRYVLEESAMCQQLSLGIVFGVLGTLLSAVYRAVRIAQAYHMAVDVPTDKTTAFWNTRIDQTSGFYPGNPTDATNSSIGNAFNHPLQDHPSPSQ